MEGYLTFHWELHGFNKFMVILLYAQCDVVITVIGEARIDFGTIATGPTSYSLTLVTPDLVSVGAIEFDLKMLEIAPKVHFTFSFLKLFIFKMFL